MSFSHRPWLALALPQGKRPAPTRGQDGAGMHWAIHGPSGARVALPQSPILRMARPVEHNPAPLSLRPLKFHLNLL
jgi:hypothetical protein